jgi:hypothetical protein
LVKLIHVKSGYIKMSGYISICQVISGYDRYVNVSPYLARLGQCMPGYSMLGQVRLLFMFRTDMAR